MHRPQGNAPRNLTHALAERSDLPDEFDRLEIRKRQILPNEWAIAKQIVENCNCDFMQIRARTCINGTVQFLRQCDACGRREGKLLSHLSARRMLNGAEPAVFDVAHEEICTETKHAFKKLPTVSRRDTAKPSGDGYQQYLQSQEWADRRERVLRRAGGFCEGCGARRATQVHHLTYENIYQEFLWQLVAVCRECHERCHPEKSEPGAAIAEAMKAGK